MKASEKKTRYPRSAIERLLTSLPVGLHDSRFRDLSFLCAHLSEEMDSLNFLIFGSGLGIWEFPISLFSSFDIPPSMRFCH
jgi:hypothetical protein